jgi:predicted nucleotidyltransferase
MSEKTGNFVLRLAPSLHRELKGKAARSGQSLNQICTDALVFALKNQGQELPIKRLNSLQAKLQKHFGEELSAIIVFGSAVKGEQFTESDIDILVVLENSQPILREIYRHWDEKIEDHKKPIINPHFVHWPQKTGFCSSLRLEVAQAHQWIFAKNPYVKRHLESLHHFFADQKVIRKDNHGQPYYVWRENA